MSKYDLQELLGLWHQEKVDVGQVIGQILQHLIAQAKDLAELKRQVGRLSSDDEDD